MTTETPSPSESLRRQLLAHTTALHNLVATAIGDLKELETLRDQLAEAKRGAAQWAEVAAGHADAREAASQELEAAQKQLASFRTATAVAMKEKEEALGFVYQFVAAVGDSLAGNDWKKGAEEALEKVKNLDDAAGHWEADARNLRRELDELDKDEVNLESLLDTVQPLMKARWVPLLGLTGVSYSDWDKLKRVTSAIEALRKALGAGKRWK
jgi:DNA repair exonuclease SbcCD ATPase subunit